jgi:hypothetical protein
MSHGPQRFWKRDVVRAIKAARAAGVPIARVEVDKDGKIIVVAGEPAKDPATKEGANEWDAI